MKIKSFNYEDENVVQIYVGKKEITDKFVSTKINNLKEDSSNKIVVFIGGDAETVPQLEQIIMNQKNYKA